MTKPLLGSWTGIAISIFFRGFYGAQAVGTCADVIQPCRHGLFFLACEQAPGGASAEQTFGEKRRAIGACTHSPKSPMSASKIWTQSDDWWSLIIHDVVLVFTSGIDKNQNGERREEVLRSTSFRIFNIYQVI